MKKRAWMILTIIVCFISLLACLMFLLQRNFEASDAYAAAAQYMASGDIRRAYGALEKTGWFSYGKVFTEGTAADMHGTAAFEYPAENERGERYFVAVRLALECGEWVVTDCRIAEVRSD